MHDADVPRIAIYSSWNGTQEIGWVRFTLRQVRHSVRPDLQGARHEGQPAGRLRRDPHADADRRPRQAVFQPPAARPVPYMKTEKYKFLGMYGESPDITGGMGGEGVDAFAKFLDAGGTLIAMGDAVRFPTDFGLARTVDASASRRRATSTRRVRS